MDTAHEHLKPTSAFIGTAWIALGLGMFGYIVGLWNAEMMLNEKGYYFAVLILGAFSTVSLQKTVRDKAEDIPVTGIYSGICWTAMFLSVSLLLIGLWNAELLLSEKGYYLMSFTLAMFGTVTVQKNIRDLKHFNGGVDLPTMGSGFAGSLFKRNSDEPAPE